jgi:hypothetical protein
MPAKSPLQFGRATQAGGYSDRSYPIELGVPDGPAV